MIIRAMSQAVVVSLTPGENNSQKCKRIHKSLGENTFSFPRILMINLDQLTFQNKGIYSYIQLRLVPGNHLLQIGSRIKTYICLKKRLLTRALNEIQFSTLHLIKPNSLHSSHQVKTAPPLVKATEN